MTQDGTTAKRRGRPQVSAEPRRKKPRQLAVVTADCTGCAGSPVCQPYCPVDECMILVQNPRAEAFAVIEVDPLKCIGCRKCTSRGPRGTYLDGCPWDAIVMVDAADDERTYGEQPC